MEKQWKQSTKGFIVNVLTNRTYRDYTNIIRTEGSINMYVYKNVKETDLEELEQLHPSEEVLISLYFVGGIRIVPIFVGFLIEDIKNMYKEEDY